MKTFDVRVFAIPCDAKGRPIGDPQPQPRQKVEGVNIDVAKKTLRDRLSQGRGRVVGISCINERSLVAYVEKA